MFGVRRGLLAAVTTALALVGLAGAPAQSADTATTFVTMVGDGDYVGGNEARLWRGPEQVAVTGSDEAVHVDVSGGTSGGYFGLSFTAPAGETLTVGQYDGAERFRGEGHAGIDIGGDGRGCNQTAGRFTVLDIAPDLSRLWLVYEQHCEGPNGPPLFGEVRYNIPGGDPALLVAASHIAWPDEYPGIAGRNVPVRLFNTGSSPVTVSSAAITAGKGDFSVAGSKCTTIAVGGTCTVNVGFKPATAGQHTGTLAIDSSTGFGVQTVDLTGAGIAGNTSFAMRSERGDYIGAGKDWFSTPADASIRADGNESSVSMGAGTWSATFAAPEGEQLLPGETFTGATRAAFKDPAEPGLDVSGDGRGCNTVKGSFTIHEAVYEAGKLQKFSATFEQHCEGARPALFGSVAWKAEDPARPLPPRITVTSDKARYRYGARMQVTAVLSKDATARALSIYATPYGGAKRLVKTAQVDSRGKVTVSVPAARRTTFTASVADPAGTRSVMAGRTVTVSAKVALTMERFRTRSGRYFIYDVSQSILNKGEVSPNHRDDCLYFRAQFYVRGAWRYPATTGCVRMSSGSVARAYLKGSRDCLGIPIRMRAEWRGDRENAATTTAWRYAKFRQ